MRYTRVTISQIVTIASLIGLAGCGGLQQASTPVIKAEHNLDDGAGQPSTPVIDGKKAASDPEVAQATQSQRRAVREAQSRVDTSRASNPGAGRRGLMVAFYAAKGQPNLLNLSLRRTEEEGEDGQPLLVENPELVLWNFRAKKGGQAYRPLRAYWMWPEDEGHDQTPAQMYEVNLTPSSDERLKDVPGHNTWFAIEPDAEISEAIAEGIPMRIRFEDENGRNAFFSSETFGPNSTAVALSNSGVRWDMMGTEQPDGTMAWDPVVVDPTNDTRQEFILRGAHEDEQQEIE